MKRVEKHRSVGKRQVRGNRRRMKKEELQDWVKLIRRLYKEHTLAEVQEILNPLFLAYFNFKLTPRQMTYIFKEYGISKYNTKSHKNNKRPVIKSSEDDNDDSTNNGYGEGEEEEEGAIGVKHEEDDDEDEDEDADLDEDDEDPDDDDYILPPDCVPSMDQWPPEQVQTKMVADLFAAACHDTHACGYYLRLFNAIRGRPDVSLEAKNSLIIALFRTAKNSNTAGKVGQALSGYLLETESSRNERGEDFFWNMVKLSGKGLSDAHGDGEDIKERICFLAGDVIKDQITLRNERFPSKCTQFDMVTYCLLYRSLKIYEETPDSIGRPRVMVHKVYLQDFLGKQPGYRLLDQGKQTIIRQCLQWCGQQLETVSLSIPSELSALRDTRLHRWRNFAEIFATLWSAAMAAISSQDATTLAWHTNSEKALRISSAELLNTVCLCIESQVYESMKKTDADNDLVLVDQLQEDDILRWASEAVKTLDGQSEYELVTAFVGFLDKNLGSTPSSDEVEFETTFHSCLERLVVAQFGSGFQDPPEYVPPLAAPVFPWAEGHVDLSIFGGMDHSLPSQMPMDDDTGFYTPPNDSFFNFPVGADWGQED